MHPQSEISCSGCPVGAAAVYGPAFVKDANRITSRRAARQSFAAQRTLMREGEVPAQVFTLFSGWAYSLKMLNDGSRQVLSFLIPGDLIGFYAFLGEPLPYSIKALTPVSLCSFDRVALFEYLQTDSELRDSLCKVAFGQLRTADEKVIDIARRPATSRVARFLLTMEQRLRARGLAAGGRYEFPVPQRLIADALGLTSVYLNRTMVALRTEGIIDFNRSEMHIHRPAALEAIADGDWHR